MSKNIFTAWLVTGSLAVAMVFVSCKKSEKLKGTQVPVSGIYQAPITITDPPPEASAEIKNGQVALQVGTAIIYDVKQLAADNEDAQLQKLLAKHPFPSYTKIETAEQSAQVQKKLENFVLELLDLSETNANAKQVINKYQIRQGSN